ncbi:hypothetical protein [Caballeronia sp. DA-9]|uniref:hypothetical protein n=1 Tax=Caballeronia sp. DA-9 TaxID=3436237 RepID=UPI003F673C1F
MQQSGLSVIDWIGVPREIEKAIEHFQPIVDGSTCVRERRILADLRLSLIDLGNNNNVLHTTDYAG